MKLFSHDDGGSSSSSNHTCPMPQDLSAEASEPFAGDMTFHTFNKILSGSCAAFVCLAIFVLMTMHATHFSNPARQIKIMRICVLLPIYAVLSFLAIAFPNSYVYLMAWVDVFQAIALCAFFFLLCDFLSPGQEERAIFFAKLQPNSKTSKPVDGLTWFKKKWIAVLQYPIVAFIDAVATSITEAADIYCLESSKAYFGHVWLNVIRILSVSVATFSILMFYATLKTHISQHKPLTKLIALKLIVGLVFLENIIFTILRSTSVLETTSKLTWSDVHMGIETLIICLQLVPIACLFHYAYGIGPYRLSRHTPVDTHDYATVDPNAPILPQRYQGGPLGIWAWFAMCNPLEDVRDVRDTFGMLNQARHGSRQILLNSPTGYP
ncbi:Transmembrane protein [Penicillium brevicompactum]|uniref:uncharacterized protein n=1 Tax=Penicillium brevicompactum TaxID=5074 RepID=UPI0025406A5A|nr:uncharacterized protein N7506_006788 [Penicillium brevicompactum]KAJ5333005.1 hypothetical protein N7506_006788 [Penicillium brevicompactum]